MTTFNILGFIITNMKDFIFEGVNCIHAATVFTLSMSSLGPERKSC